MKQLFAIVICSMFYATTYSQNMMNIYQCNGTTLQIPTSCIDSITYSTSANTLATITTSNATAITPMTVTSGGNITSDGGTPVTTRGVCYSTSPNPTTANPKVTSGSGIGSFTVTINGLTASTTYYLKAYATNSAGTVYGNQVSFTTSSPTIPTVTTSSVYDISGQMAKSDFLVTNTGGAALIEVGICYGTTTNPTLAGSHVPSSVLTTSAPIQLNGLNNSTTYYIRAYATNSVGTAYGNEVNFQGGVVFTNGGGVTDIDGNVYTTIILNSQEWMQENLKTTHYQDGSPITEIEDSLTWLNIYYTNIVTPAWCYVSGNASTNSTYGKLYNWYAVADPRNVCPTGWRVPSDTDYATLIDYHFGGHGFKALTLWSGSANPGDNSSGFSGLPAGYRYNGSPSSSLGLSALFWTSSVYSSVRANYYSLYYLNDNFSLGNTYKSTGKSVRCIKN